MNVLYAYIVVSLAVILGFIIALSNKRGEISTLKDELEVVDQVNDLFLKKLRELSLGEETDKLIEEYKLNLYAMRWQVQPKMRTIMDDEY